MLRGRLRKCALEKEIDFLTENASDKENCVRFALHDDKELSLFTTYLKSIIPDVHIECVESNGANPVLSKLKVNDESRYTL